MAERGGFELPIAFQLYMISSHAHSTTLPSLRVRFPTAFRDDGVVRCRRVGRSLRLTPFGGTEGR